MPSNTLNQDEIAGLLEATAAHLQRTPAEIPVSFVSVAQIQAFNREHRGKDVPTDVLSFPFDDAFPHGRGGEVLICAEVAARNAAERSRPVRDELALLIVHGALHVYGMEDETLDGTAAMDRTQTAILRTAWSGTSE